ncbi:putative protein TPRXL isoform X2 [Punica granatum]|uniref:Uncharacterized protein n=1 Tax=Punica granatum TaxID=22663 RepID=A0A218X5K4_PUNGR|nr:putative protein TPRXL isoform X2 [Punica granatum]OWM80078.1 hypothetical protein CDL15_Pgr010056 [Punica granatum]
MRSPSTLPPTGFELPSSSSSEDLNERWRMASNTSATSSSSPSTATAGSPCGKRARDPEDEVYVDNLHSHKRYLSEIMASSLNGLTVGDPLSENLMESPARSESMFYLRDDMSLQYSPMSEDSDDSRYCETGPASESLPTSPVSSPHRTQRPLSVFQSVPPTTASSSTSSQSRQRGSDSEGRFPSSPSDICHSADLRRAALLRSVQMRTQPSAPSAYDLHFGSVQESVSNVEADDRGGLYMKSLGEEKDYRAMDYPSILGMPGEEFNREKSCLESDINSKRDESRT